MNYKRLGKLVAVLAGYVLVAEGIARPYVIPSMQSVWLENLCVYSMGLPMSIGIIFLGVLLFELIYLIFKG